MKKYIKLTFLLLFFVMFTTAAFAQKYGHLNSGNLLAQMPEAEKANTTLKTYQEQLVKQHEAKLADFQTRGAKFMQEYNEGNLTMVVAQQKQAAFQKEQEELIKGEQEIMLKVQKRREELLKPILTKVDEAIQAVGKENNYKMIFDTSIMNALLFVQDSDDVMALVKAKLGM